MWSKTSLTNAAPTFIAESMCVPGDNNVCLVSVPRPMPCVVIFVHGVNSEGEWYSDAENGIVDGLNERLGRADLRINDSSKDKRTLISIENSPVINFYWGYRAPEEQTAAGTFPYKIPLKVRDGAAAPNGGTSYTYYPYSFKRPDTNLKGTYYWGGGPFQNGTTALNASWYDGFDPKVFGFVDVGSRTFNPEPDRPLNKSPKRTYYVNASLRLAKLIDSIYEKYPNDTVAVVSHSQGTMIAALAMLYVKQLPDTLFLCNSPYSFEDKGVDGITMGGNAPTAASRVKTFFNILDRFKESQGDVERKITEEQLEGVGGWLDIETQESKDGRSMAETKETDGPSIDSEPSFDYKVDQSVKWKPTIATEEPVPGKEDHHNHGRVFVYCSPHDRVMGSTPLQSIGWKGVDYRLPDPDLPRTRVSPFEKYNGEGKPVLFQRQFMRTHSVGSTPDADGPRTPRYPNDGLPLWIPPSPKVANLINEMTDIGREERIFVNAPRVPNPMPADKMKAFNEGLAEDESSRKKISKDDDFPYYKELIYEKRKWVDNEPSVYENQHRQHLQTEEEVALEIDTTDAIPTNHSTILTYLQGELVKRVLAYDLPIGRADSFSDRPFWKKLIKDADWLESGSDENYAQGGDFQAPPPPAGIDVQTRQIVIDDVERTRKLYGIGK
ncbi:T6SS effector phospholipase Tle3 domain-containing protein [Caballeronia sp.]|uniref:T6SS effector phospholipase Tle3 domain-containing protein n=1 Tax=Caballeronia sp. TaxID=1931223 RepID=UPI003C63E0E7